MSSKLDSLETHMDTKNILLHILAERKRQDEKWGEQRDHNPAEWMLIFMEEVGEVAESFLQGDVENARVELIQVAALIVAWLESSYAYPDSNSVWDR